MVSFLKLEKFKNSKSVTNRHWLFLWVQPSAAKRSFVLRINIIYFGNLARFSVNSFTQFLLPVLWLDKVFPAGLGTRKNVRRRPNLLCALASLEYCKVPYFNYFPGQEPPFQALRGFTQETTISVVAVHYCITNIAQTLYTILLLFFAVSSSVQAERRQWGLQHLGTLPTWTEKFNVVLHIAASWWLPLAGTWTPERHDYIWPPMCMDLPQCCGWHWRGRILTASVLKRYLCLWPQHSRRKRHDWV